MNKIIIVILALTFIVGCKSEVISENTTYVNTSFLEKLKTDFATCYDEGMWFKEQYEEYKSKFEAEKGKCNQSIINDICDRRVKEEIKKENVCLPYITTVKRLENEKVALLLSNDTARCVNLEHDLENCNKWLDEARIKINETLELLE